MKSKEIRALTKEEIKSRLSEFRKELMKENMKRAMGTPTKPKKIREIKRNLARLLTISKEKT